jgi:opacity protein-like surface antigen
MILAVFAVMCLAGVGSLSAQQFRYGVSGGLLLPMGDYKNIDKAGFLVGVDGTYWLTGNQVGIRLDASYSTTSEKSGVPAHKTKMLGGMAEVVYAFMTPADPVRPYILGGAGVFNVKLSVSGGDTTETKFGFGGGAGLDFKLGSGTTRVFVEGRYTSVKAFGSTVPFLGVKAGIRF